MTKVGCPKERERGNARLGDRHHRFDSPSKLSPLVRSRKKEEEKEELQWRPPRQLGDSSLMDRASSYVRASRLARGVFWLT